MSDNTITLRDDVSLEGGPHSFDILVDGEVVGVVEGGPCTFRDIQVAENRQGGRIGTTATALWVEKHRDDCAVIETSTVVSGAMARILRRLGFVPKRGGENHFVLDTTGGESR